MMPQGADRVQGEYIGLYCCTNTECKAVFEEYSDLKGVSLSSKNQWWNPKTEEFEK